MSRGLDTRWTRNLKDPKAKSDFEIILRNSTLVNSRLVQLLEEIRRDTLKTKFTDYESASWAYKQADQNGYIRAIDDIISLFKYMEN